MTNKEDNNREDEKVEFPTKIKFITKKITPKILYMEELHIKKAIRLRRMAFVIYLSLVQLLYQRTPTAICLAPSLLPSAPLSSTRYIPPAFTFMSTFICVYGKVVADVCWCTLLPFESYTITVSGSLSWL